MNTEKIAFLFPYSEEGGKDKIPSPLLAFDCEEFPTEIDLHAGIFFIGLEHKKPYFLEVQILLSEEDKDREISVKKGVWVRANDSQGKETDIAASVDICLKKCKFIKAGSYFLEATLFVEKEKMHSNRAYFRVSSAS